MSYLWDFFDNVNELAYALDMDSHEILYMNRKALETYGIFSVNELKGKKCYEVLYGNHSPCEMCNNEQLLEGEFEKRKYFNPVFNKYFLLMATMINENGRRHRFEIAIDINENEDYRQVTDRYRNLESIVSEGIKQAICEPNPNKSIGIILEFLGKILRGERAYIFEKNLSGRDDNTYEWVAAGVTPEKDNLQNLPPEICENWYRCFNGNRNILFDDIEKMRQTDPLQYENLKRQNIHSIVVVPLYGNNEVIGFYGIDNPPKQDLNYALDMLQIVGYFISSILKKRDYINQIREMSLHDQLTKLGNRYAMDEYSSNIESSKSIGVVYCDITGLKRTNDTLGHKKGDELICRACESLKSSFGEYGLFRIGGDELLAICVDIDDDTLKKRIALLREKTDENSVVLAIGAAWEGNFQNNLQKIIDEAERLMYQEKSEYYRTIGIDRRR